MPDTPTYLVTARAVNPLAQRLDDPEPLPGLVATTRRSTSTAAEPHTPTSYRRAWFDYVRESGHDLD